MGEGWWHKRGKDMGLPPSILPRGSSHLSHPVPRVWLPRGLRGGQVLSPLLHQDPLSQLPLR